MNILEIYKKYQIMPQLAEHQLKVAGVAKVILDNLVPPQPSAKGGHLLLFKPDPQSRRPQGAGTLKDIIVACFLHDMGNIIKFDLSVTDKFLPGKFSKEDLEYWQTVKEEYILKYGTDEHLASLEIAREIGVSERIMELIDCIGFQNGKINAETEDFGRKICAYSDMRVEPIGVVFLEQRFLGLRERYDHKHRLMGGGENLRLEFEAGLREIEKQIFAKCKIKPGDITEEEVREEMESLENYKI